MQVKFIDNQLDKVGPTLNSGLGSALITRIAVAFVSSSGLDSLQGSLVNNLEQGRVFEILVGLDFAITDPKALKLMFDWSKRYPNFRFFIQPPGGANSFHPKMYLLETATEGLIIIGSSNLTEAGLYKNAEANIFVQSERTAEVFTDALESYVRLKFDDRRIPNEDFILVYEEASLRIAESRRSYRVSELDALGGSVKSKFDSLPKPTPTKSDLVGWLELVYDVLPDTAFETRDIYEFESKFKSKFPENKNIRPKIRQQLQFLRDMGFLEHLSQGVWRKV